MATLPNIAIFPLITSEEGVDLTFVVLVSDDGAIAVDINGTLWNGHLSEILSKGWNTMELDTSEDPQGGLKVAHTKCLILTGEIEKSLTDWQDSVSASEEEQRIKRETKVAQSILNSYDAGQRFVAVRRPALERPLKRRRSPLRR